MIFWTWKGTHFQDARTTLTQFRASWRPEKAIFRNRKVIAFSSQKAIFRTCKITLFQGTRTTLTQFRVSCRPEKANLTNLKEIASFSSKSDFSEFERGRFWKAPELPWRNFERLGDLKKQFFQTWKKSLSAGKAIFPNLKGDAFWGRQNNLDAISSVLATWKSKFSES